MKYCGCLYNPNSKTIELESFFEDKTGLVSFLIYRHRFHKETYPFVLSAFIYIFLKFTGILKPLLWCRFKFKKYKQ